MLAFLERMQDDQNSLTKYASAPLGEMMSSLGEAGPMVLESLQAQIFNWVPGMGATGSNPFSNFETLGAMARPEICFPVNAGIGGQDTDTVFLHLRGRAFARDEFKRIAGDLAKITCWLTEHLHASVGGFRDCLGQLNGKA
jgi:hypothetical protein